MAVAWAQYKEKNTSSEYSCQLDSVNPDIWKHRSTFRYAMTCLLDLGLQYWTQVQPMANFNFYHKSKWQTALFCNATWLQLVWYSAPAGFNLSWPHKRERLLARTYRVPHGNRMLQHASHAFFGTVNLPSIKDNVCPALLNNFQTLFT